METSSPFPTVITEGERISIMWIEPGTLAPVATALEGAGYRSFSSPGDRHGSWEWPFSRSLEGLTRFVVLTATPLDSGADFSLEFWICADADQRFTRRRLMDLVVSVSRLPASLDFLKAQAEKAALEANSLKESDLKDTYPRRAASRSVSSSRAERRLSS
jgi:hypothetical protein